MTGSCETGAKRGRHSHDHNLGTEPSAFDYKSEDPMTRKGSRVIGDQMMYTSMSIVQLYKERRGVAKISER